MEVTPLFENIQTKSSTFQASVNLFKASIGIGILALPYNFNDAGYLFSTIFIVLLSTITFYSSVKIIELAELKGLTDDATFESLYKDIVGEISFICFQICMFVAYLGTCICYVIFFIGFLNDIFETDSIYYTLLYSFLSLCVIIPLSLITKFEFFVKYSIFASLLILIVILFVIGYCMEHLTNNPQNLMDFSKASGVMGVFLFAFECPGQILTIRNSMKDKHDFKKMYLFIMIFLLTIYVVFSLFCCFGLTKIQLTSNILIGFGNINEFYMALQGLYALALIVSYPLQLNPCILILESIPKIKEFIEKHKKQWFYKNCIKILISFFIVPCGLYITSLADFISFLGNFTGFVIQFVIPLRAYDIFMGKSLSIYVRVFHSLIIFISVLATIFNCYQSILTLIDDFTL